MRCTASVTTPTTWSPSGTRTTCLWPRRTSRGWWRRSAGSPSRRFPPPSVTVDRGHGRLERRTVRAAPMPEWVGFPHAEQVLVADRHVSDLAGGSGSTEVAYAVTSLSFKRADAARLGGLLRGRCAGSLATPPVRWHCWASERMGWPRAVKDPGSEQPCGGGRRSLPGRLRAASQAQAPSVVAVLLGGLEDQFDELV